MAENEYLDGLIEAYQGEVRGEAMFSTLAERTGDEGAARKWRLLARLETVTKARLKPLLEAHGLDATEDEAQRRLGAERGIERSGQDWGQAIATLAASLPHYIDLYGRYEALAPPQDRDAMAFLMAHEYALLDFAERVRNGEDESALDPILPLLEIPSD